MAGSAPASPKADIRDLDLDGLERAVAATGQPSYRGRQVAQWLYQRGVESFAAMTNLPLELREYLNQNFKLSPLPATVVRAATDGTRKLLLGLVDGQAIESVIIPGAGRTTLCISSQVGCGLGCDFCATARMGLKRNLAVNEIVGQVIAARRYLEPGEGLSNYVFMGMGEPLANYDRLIRALKIMTAPWGMAISPRRITVSTVGLVPLIERLLADSAVNLAVSLHATTDQSRDLLVPINRRYPLAELLAACRKLDLGRRRITFEYVMLAGVNDSDADAHRLIKLMAPLRAKVNLICFNPFPGVSYQGSSRERLQAFQALLVEGNLTATIRESRGRDIAAACGQLRVEQERALQA